ncbi:aminotransferase class V-fold PLP-dependent enzyme [Sphingomonas changnyeongensis]|uniref:Aminotransferase class V-fold PLP-dependent enzyme n=1 Tax=Sphingomonas changnyeongensis TaxID=2698679 RepID=A0A7Z2NV09_9SPHN|nr:DegT/DnrJ/EryC1/StrS family aminotransferase [Sphingomonas changnyeongensis]QHL90232.1 aminotransferase class V-fold PLP-dependent enzyme [Sphingomonas changnyeongensis]
MNRIHYTKPSITDLEVAYATDAARNGWGPDCYNYLHRLERDFAAHLGVAHAIATSSCTGALHMGLAALGIGEGDEVILGDINWIASAAPIVHVGAKPVFVDVLEDSWCIDPDRVEAAITPRTKAIIAVHLYGNLAALDALSAIADRHGLVIIEDAAEALGSVWHGRRAGSIGRFGTFSFHGTKTMTTGEGGMFVTNDAELYEHVLTLSNHGRARSQRRQFWADEVGFKYKMSNIAAAIGCAQIERIEELVARKRWIFDQYRSRLAGLPLRMNPEPQNCSNGYWMPTIVVDAAIRFDRARLLDRFAENNIDGRVFFWPLSMLPAFEERRQENPVSYGLYERAVNLPSYHEISEDDIQRVCDVVRNAL